MATGLEKHGQKFVDVHYEVYAPRVLAGLLNPLGLFRQQRREGERRKWCYLLSEETLADLRARYGAPVEAGPET